MACAKGVLLYQVNALSLVLSAGPSGPQAEAFHCLDSAGCSVDLSGVPSASHNVVIEILGALLAFGAPTVLRLRTREHETQTAMSSTRWDQHSAAPDMNHSPTTPRHSTRF